MEDDIDWLNWQIDYYEFQIAELKKERRTNGVVTLTKELERLKRFLKLANDARSAAQS